MFPAFLLALREGLEIALVIGIVLGSLHKVKRSDLDRVMWMGVVSAAAISLVVALGLTSLDATLEGQAEQVFEGVMMLLAAGVLTWMIFWMNRQAQSLKGELEAGVRQATQRSGIWALFGLAFVAVLREGIELALFLTAAVAASGARQAALGGLLGLLAAALLGWGLFAAALRLDLRRFFQVTSALLILFAAGLVAHGVHEFNEIGWIPPIIEHVWDVNPILSEDSVLGSIFKTLFGYNANPSLTEILAYLAYFASVVFALRLASPPAPNKVAVPE